MNHMNIEAQNRIEVVTLTPIMLGQCSHCEMLMNSFGANHTRRQLNEYPKEILDQSLKLTEFINTITANCYASISIIEALSVKGLLKLLRHKNGKLPVIIINGKKISSGPLTSIQPLIENIMD